MIYKLICGTFLLLLFSGCQSLNNATCLEPSITYLPVQRHISRLPSPFKCLNIEERCSDWGKEYMIGVAFARELDLYRAITAFKRASFLLPKDHCRRMQVEYCIVLCYYLGSKYLEAVEIFETGSLIEADEHFPGFKNLLLLLYDSYYCLEIEDRMIFVERLIQQHFPDESFDLLLLKAVLEGELEHLSCLIEEHCPCPEDSKKMAFDSFIDQYATQKKSVRTAQLLNGILPGAGYYYVGLKKTALTSFLLNTVFTAAAYQLFDRGYTAGGLIVTSLELGWYLGGINGAGLAAKEYNESLYNQLGKELLCKQQLFPVLMFQYAF